MKPHRIAQILRFHSIVFYWIEEDSKLCAIEEVCKQGEWITVERVFDCLTTREALMDWLGY